MPRVKTPQVKGESEGKCPRCSEVFDKTTPMGDWTFDIRTGKWTCPRCSHRLAALARFKKTGQRKEYMTALTCNCGALDENYEEVRPHAKECKVR